MKIKTVSFLVWFLFFIAIFDVVFVEKQKSFFKMHFSPDVIEKEDTSLSVAFLWDVMIWGRVGENIDKKWMWAVVDGTKWYLSKRDAVVMNLETTVTDQTKKMHKTYTFKAKPEHLEWLKAFNEKLVVNLANNHMYDFFEEWLKDTLVNLDNAWVDYHWAWNNAEEAYSYKMSQIWVYKFAFLWQNCVWPVRAEANEHKAWIAFFNEKKLEEQIKLAKEKADFVVFSAHCWTEYSDAITSKQRTMYKKAIDFGADVVMAHHPHWYQAVEKYKDKMIFYSLWDYIFDIHRNTRAEEGLIVTMNIEDWEIKNYVIIPTVIKWFGETYFPTKQKRKEILNNLYKISKKFGDNPTLANWIISLKD